MGIVNDLMRRIKSEATDDKLFESMGIQEIKCIVGDKVILRGKGGEVYEVEEIDEEEDKYMVTGEDGKSKWVNPGQIEKKLENKPKNEGYDEAGKRDGTGPYKDSYQRRVKGDRGKVKGSR